ncbi:MAG: zinc-dependent peptidase [Verrucomicrobiales bacterium]
MIAFLAVRYWREADQRGRRSQLLAEGLSAADWVMIDRAAALLRRLPEDLRRRVGGIVRVLMEEKNFEACGGLDEVTSEMRLVVLAQAALLLVGRPLRFYPRLRSVLLYPDAYEVEDDEGRDVRLGESWESGSVVLSWKSVLGGGRNEEDGLNVVLHEFAHQLDQEDGSADGLPILADGMSYRDWARAFRGSYERFCAEVERGRRTVLDPYGATDPAEFFAVATETFFEKPRQLRESHGEIYVQLQAYYGLDPVGW